MMAQSLNDVKNVIGLWVTAQESSIVGIVAAAFYDEGRMTLRIEWEDGEVTFAGLAAEHLRFFKTRDQAIQANNEE